MVRRCPWLLLICAQCVLRAECYATTQAMGFHEGARRTVKCDGGYITGFDAYLGFAMGFTESTVTALRVKCSSGKIVLEHKGSTSDEYVFGNHEPNAARPQSVSCPQGQGVAAIEWRGASSSEADHTARIGGIRVHCGTQASASPLTIDAAPTADKQYPNTLKCSDLANSAKASKLRATSVEVWFEQAFSGLHLTECEEDKV